MGNLSTFLKKIEQKYQKLAEGTSRSVFLLNDETVLKVAKSQAGLAQNRVECKLAGTTPLIAKIFDKHPNDIWITMEYVRPAELSDFDRLLNFNLEDIYAYIYATVNNVKELINDIPNWEKLSKDPFVLELQRFADKNFLLIADLTDGDNWGVVVRNNKERLVLLDFGCDNKTFCKYYGYYKL